MTDQQRPTLCRKCGGHIDRCGCTPLSEINAALLRRKREAEQKEARRIADRTTEEC